MIQRRLKTKNKKYIILYKWKSKRRRSKQHQQKYNNVKLNHNKWYKQTQIHINTKKKARKRRKNEEPSNRKNFNCIGSVFITFAFENGKNMIIISFKKQNKNERKKNNSTRRTSEKNTLI